MNKVSSIKFEELIRLDEVILYDVLKYKKIVKGYGEIIKKVLLEDNSSAKILLDKYEMNIDLGNKKIYLPDELTKDDKEQIILNYIDSPIAHLNVLEVIRNIRNRSEFSISPKTKLKAKIRIDKEKYLSKNLGIETEFCVSFSKKQTEEIIFEDEGEKIKYSYSSNWIEENKDFNTLLNNFIYLFDYADWQMRITFVSKMIEMGILERTVFFRSRYDYPNGITFKSKNILALLKMTSYYLELEKNNIRLEEIIEWFFKSYVKEEFGVEGFTIKLPSKNSTYLEKCRIIFPEMESVLRQYKLYVEDGYINKELLEISSTSLDYGSLPSILTEKKYVYGKGEKFEKVRYYLTSDQCMLTYVKRIGDKYENFYELICNELVNINDYIENYNYDINWLVDNNIIVVKSNGDIKWKDEVIVAIFMDLSINDVISYWRYPKTFRNKIDELKENDFLEFSCSLLSKPEQDYISFLLNKNKFSNGYDIRNKCIHGTQANSENGKETHKVYYMYAIIVFIICIIKINDELCIFDSFKKN